MTAETRAELVRLGLTLVPALLIAAVGCLLASQGPLWLGLAIGGGIAATLGCAGGLVVAATHDRPLHVAAMAALASFIIRIGGAGVAAVLSSGQPWSNAALAGLAGGLLASLVIDLWTWSRVASQGHATAASAKETARA
jgi:hypothetical protein